MYHNPKMCVAIAVMTANVFQSGGLHCLYRPMRNVSYEAGQLSEMAVLVHVDQSIHNTEN